MGVSVRIAAIILWYSLVTTPAELVRRLYRLDQRPPCGLPNRGRRHERSNRCTTQSDWRDEPCRVHGRDPRRQRNASAAGGEPMPRLSRNVVGKDGLARQSGAGARHPPRQRRVRTGSSDGPQTRHHRRTLLVDEGAVVDSDSGPRPTPRASLEYPRLPVDP